MMDDDSDTITTVSGSDVIMAYGETMKYYNEPDKVKRVCTCLFWSQYLLFILNFFVWAAGVTSIGLGTWAQVSEPGLELFQSLLTVPSWLLIGAGIVMVLMGMLGCAGTLLLNLYCLRTFMVLLVAVFVLQVAIGVVFIFIVDDLHYRMLIIVKTAIMNYNMDGDAGRDRALDYLQREFTCCGASSYSDWEANHQYNCTQVTSPSSCGVPTSCCRGSREDHCGHGVRYGTKDYSEMLTYTDGCVVTLMGILKENYILIACLACTVCILEMCCLVLSSVISNRIVRQRKLRS